MADLVVKDLDNLIANLNEIISQFEGALDFENDNDHIWGQHNANLSMGDFADNWTHHRDDMVKDMKKFRDKVQKVDEAWASADRQLADSLNQDGK